MSAHPVRKPSGDLQSPFFIPGIADLVCAMERKLRILRGMGVNAIRTSHNMPDPQLMDLADSMGFLVLSEAFDS